MCACWCRGRCGLRSSTRASPICRAGSSPGDLLVVNTSGTLNAALAATPPEGSAFELHLSTQLPGGFWIVELRHPATRVAAVSSTRLRARRSSCRPGPRDAARAVSVPGPLASRIAALGRCAGSRTRCIPYLERHGPPIRYGYVGAWPVAMYQTVFAGEPGSAEMPSAGRPFTPELVTRLVSRGIEIAPLLLHTGVASLESHEPPYEELLPSAAGDGRARQRGQTRRPSRSSRSARRSCVRSRRCGRDEDGRLQVRAGRVS